MTNNTLILDRVYGHERAHPDKLFLTQPTGGGAVAAYGAPAPEGVTP